MRRNLLILPLVLWLTGCAGAPAPAPVTEQAELNRVEVAPEQGEQTTPAAEPGSTPTLDFVLLFTPAPTETPLPPLDLPSPLPDAPALLAWDGLPTYLAESQPDFFFRLLYDPDVWALTKDDFGQPALGHRAIPYCVLAPAAGRGLPLNLVVEHEIRRLGEVTYEVNTAYLNGRRQFVTYLGGDGIIYTGFQVNFQEDEELCLTDAETVLGRLSSVPQSQATPIP